VLAKVQTIDWRTREPIPDDEVAALVRALEPLPIVLAPADDPARVAAILGRARGNPRGRSFGR
jgi:hypothetical protein